MPWPCRRSQQQAAGTFRAATRTLPASSGSGSASPSSTRLARGFADRDPARAFANGLRVIDFESNANALYELTAQRLVAQSHVLATVAVSGRTGTPSSPSLGLALLWVYLRRNEHFLRFRNTLLLANVIGLVGYVLLPTAPPRMFPGFGFGGTFDRTTTASCSSPRTRTQPCRASTPPTR